MFKKFKIPLTPEERIKRRNHLLLGLLSGILLGISFPPIPLWILTFAALVPYFLVLEEKEGLAEINRFTYFTMFFFNLITLYWVGSWTKDADPFLMISGTVLMFFNPLLFLIPSTFYYFARKSFGKTTALIGFPLFWVSYEFLYSITDFRFPWLILGNSQSKNLLFIQIADIIGASGLSLLIIFINILLYLIVKEYLESKRLSSIKSAILVLLISLPLIYGNFRLNNYEITGSRLKVGVVQPNLNPWKKWEAGNLSEQLDLYLNLSKETIKDSAQIIIWPESALPVYLLSSNYPNEVNTIHKFVDANNIILLTGMPHINFFKEDEAPKNAKRTNTGRYLYTSYNSVLMFKPNSRKIDYYGKIKLVPFGEKVPLVEHIPFLGDLLRWNVGISSWNVGNDTVVFNTKLESIAQEIKPAGVICIESIYPDFVAQFVDKGANLLTVVTNDSWYGNSSGPYQHKEISVLRAVENRRFLVRSANGGISCIIDPLGNTTIETEMFTKEAFVGEVNLIEEKTFYTKNPLIVPYLSLAFSIWVLAFYWVRKFTGGVK
ncbi:MAG: apolipoprotein N-acyltransferase [Melioribacteraceae bacterium]|nr:apolipoprotein N-acyltransferase [Melioribacteraceae bacterium]